MAWCAGRLPVPEIVDYGCDEDVEWLVTIALPGVDATKMTDDPATTVRVLGEGLREFHEVAADDCPFDFRLDAALDHCARRVAGDGVPASKGDFHDVFLHLSPAAALEELRRTRPVSEDVVLCHGDYCFPNVLIENGRAVGYLDLGELGVADRWWDLAVASWSCDWNVGSGWNEVLYSAYGIEPDEDRIRYYRLMYDLAS
jgi:kanamycin kinase